MGKQSKRSRKFERTGGVKSRLEKGTITHKGKLKRHRKTTTTTSKTLKNQDTNKSKIQHEKQTSTKNSTSPFANNFLDDDAVADLNLETFFEKTVEDLTKRTHDENYDDDHDDDDEDDEKIHDENEQGEEDDDIIEEDDHDGDSSSESSDSNDDDDDDIEAAAERMQKEMDKLSRSDPEFHAFLEENEKELLDFQMQNDMDIDDEDDGKEDQDDDEDDDSQQEEEGRKRKQDNSSTVIVTTQLLDKIVQGAFKSHGVKSLRRLLQIYKVACHLSDSDVPKANSSGTVYHIDNRKIFNQVLVMTLTKCHTELQYHLLGRGSKKPGKHTEGPTETEETEDGNDTTQRGDNDPIQPKKLMRSFRWKEMHTILQVFFRATLHLLSEGKDSQQLTFILKALAKYIPYLTPIPKISQMLLRSLTDLWSAPLDSSQEYQVVRLHAFVRIRQLAITQPFPFIEDCLKKTYLAYAKRAKFGTSAALTSVLPTLTFMGNCIVELYSLDFHSSYQHGFVYIRQLALHLRSAMQKKSVEAFQVVYCWQYIHCLKLWTAVLVQGCKMAKAVDSTRSADGQLLQSLIYPLSEVIQGVVRLIPTTRHLPLRLHCVRFLQQLAAASERFIPTTSILIEALELNEFSMKPKKDTSKSASRGVQLPLILKLPKENTLRTAEQMEACMAEIFVLLNLEIDLYRYSPGFLEFSVWIRQRLRKFIKSSPNARWRAYAKGCLDVAERYADFCHSERSLRLSEAPKDVKRLEALKPVSEASMCERYETAVSKQKRLEEAARPASKVTKTPPAAKTKSITNQPKKSTPSSKTTKTMAIEEDALAQNDEVAEGVDWSDDDAQDDDDDDDSE